MAAMHEIEELRNRHRVFRDRFEAGRVLGRMLAPACRDVGDAIVLAVPMGGIPVASAIAEKLNLPMDLVIARKIQIPGNTEAGFGAVTADGKVFLNEPLAAQLGLTGAQVRERADEVRRQLGDRNRRLRGGRPLPELAGRTVILVDDGLASGFTMKAALHMAAGASAAAIVVAVPTAPLRTLESLGGGAVDAIYCANVREESVFAVADAYERWHDLSESEALALLPRGGGG